MDPRQNQQGLHEPNVGFHPKQRLPRSHIPAAGYHEQNGAIQQFQQVTGNSFLVNHVPGIPLGHGFPQQMPLQPFFGQPMTSAIHQQHLMHCANAGSTYYGPYQAQQMAGQSHFAAPSVQVLPLQPTRVASNNHRRPLPCRSQRQRSEVHQKPGKESLKVARKLEPSFVPDPKTIPNLSRDEVFARTPEYASYLARMNLFHMNPALLKDKGSPQQPSVVTIPKKRSTETVLQSIPEETSQKKQRQSLHKAPLNDHHVASGRTESAPTAIADPTQEQQAEWSSLVDNQPQRNHSQPLPDQNEPQIIGGRPVAEFRASLEQENARMDSVEAARRIDKDVRKRRRGAPTNGVVTKRLPNRGTYRNNQGTKQQPIDLTSSQEGLGPVAPTVFIGSEQNQGLPMQGALNAYGKGQEMLGGEPDAEGEVGMDFYDPKYNYPAYNVPIDFNSPEYDNAANGVFMDMGMEPPADWGNGANGPFFG